MAVHPQLLPENIIEQMGAHYIQRKVNEANEGTPSQFADITGAKMH